MALTEEQRSLLQLLLGGQRYDEIASLLGVSSDEVRSQARGALTAIGGQDPDAEVAVTDFLLGQADPIGRADAVRHLQNDPDANALATNLHKQLRLLGPQADLPEIPPARGGRRGGAPTPPPASPASTPPAGAPPAAGAPTSAPASPGRDPLASRVSSRVSGAFSGIGSDKRRAQLFIGLGALAVLVVAGVLAITGAFGGDGDDGGTTADTTTPTDENLTIVQLAPLGGDSEAAGQAVFAQANDQPLLQINLTGLDPSPEGQTYIVWLYNSDAVAFPLARDQVGADGNLTGAAPVPQELLPLLSQFGCVDVSIASNDATQAALQEAVQGQSLPKHSGDTVLRGQIPTQAGQQAPSGAEASCQGTTPTTNGDTGAGGNGAGGNGAGGNGAGGNGGGAQQTPTP
jgi:hypothetical protein